MKILFAILLLLVSGVAHAEQWLCMSEKSTGFHFVNSEWQVTHFEDTVYIFDSDIAALEPFALNESFAVKIIKPFESGLLLGGDCKMVTHWQSEATVECSSSGRDFMFNTITQRFMMIYKLGYWIGKDKEGQNTPFMELGRCSLL